MTTHTDYFGTKLWGSALQRMGAQCTVLTGPGAVRNLRQGILWEVTGICVGARNFSIYKVYTYIVHVLFKK